MQPSALLAGAVLASALSAHAVDASGDGGPGVVPYRPGLSTPALRRHHRAAGKLS